MTIAVTEFKILDIDSVPLWSGEAVGAAVRSGANLRGANLIDPWVLRGGIPASDVVATMTSKTSKTVWAVEFWLDRPSVVRL